jgi:hypothetical protein
MRKPAYRSARVTLQRHGFDLAARSGKRATCSGDRSRASCDFAHPCDDRAARLMSLVTNPEATDHNC